MNDEDIQILNGNNYSQVSQILDDFLKTNDDVFTFPYLSENNRRVSLWAALFQHLQNKSSEPIHTLCLATIRLLSRDKNELESLICEKWVLTLIERAGLFNFVDPEDTMDINMPAKEVVMEALKCLCNIAFNSEVARALCAHSSIAQGLVARLRSYKEIPFKDDIMLFDMKLLFILTALRPDIKTKIKDELHGMDYLVSCMNELVLASHEPQQDVAGCTDIEMSHNCLLLDHQQAIACEILKTQFNLTLHTGSSDPVSEEEEVIYLKLMPSLTALLYARTTSQEKLMELHSNIANLLTSVPPVFYQFLTPELNEGESAQYVYDGHNMDALQSLLQLLLYRLSITETTKNQYENLSPILTVLNKSARSCRVQRKFLRQEVLPPLRDVSRPPEQGDTLRNQLCRLLTTPITSVRDLVAEFLFILCKEKVGRMVKYTGFGNAAGHLAQKGLMGGGRGPAYSSSSDSDTEEYREAEPHIDPVVGCTRPPRNNPWEGMTDEQKEYEAMKLVNLFDKMLSQGVVKPARVGPDGRPQTLDHVMELREQPHRSNS
ncbi:putative synembryn-A [Danaus plexippus plexippus]|uniref:Synembryn-A n=1 Tax=Danaus plexippus plexippus TaxID=278856 RepID=A0A212FI06_DANPL|nr:putative synembryn-A [Danaus plexippus plexippus]